MLRRSFSNLEGYETKKHTVVCRHGSQVGIVGSNSVGALRVGLNEESSDSECERKESACHVHLQGERYLVLCCKDRKTRLIY